MFKKIIAFSILLFATSISIVYGQTTYAITNDKKIYQVNSDYSLNYICTAGPTQYLINDIAITPSGIMYGIAYNTLYQINLSNGSAIWIADFPPNFYVSLVCSNDYELYMINSLQKTLYKYNVQTNVLTNVAYLGFETSGDLAYYQGHLIFQSYNDSGSMYMIKAFNTQTNALIDVMCQPNYFQLWGLTNYNACNGEIILAVNPANEFLEINLNTQSYTSFPFFLPNSQTIFGLARSDEFLGSICQPEVLPDLNCMTLSLEEYSQSNFTVYPNPVDKEINIKSNSEISEIQVYDAMGKLIKELKGNKLESLDVTNLSKGFYLLKVKSGDFFSTRKFLKN
ncbi:MAG: T9SS type A sorting domain-containing protein [Bacteroidota bacterium]